MGGNTDHSTGVYRLGIPICIGRGIAVTAEVLVVGKHRESWRYCIDELDDLCRRGAVSTGIYCGILYLQCA